jgi:hypothetical protein
MNYPKQYHKAAAHLVAHGAHAETEQGRQLCADALKAMRAVGADEARRARGGLRFISGCLPVKGGE